MNLSNSLKQKMFLWLIFTMMLFRIKAQDITYTPLFTNATFTKTIDVSKPVGTIAANADGVVLS